MKIAFFVWNPFQIYQFESIVRNLESPTYVLEKRRGIEFERLFSSEFRSTINAPVIEVTRAAIPSLDGQFDAILCQTAFGHMERFEKTKVVGLQYSMSKERHQYGPWRALCDLNLVYGQYSYDRISPYSPSVQVGNPRMDRWFSGDFEAAKLEAVRARLDPSKRTILYLPTWGDLSSMTHFGQAVADLSKDYNVIAKVHHKTDSHESARKMTLTESGVQDIFGAADDLLYLLHEADVVLSDFSGAIFDALNVSKPVILLQRDPEDLAKAGAEKFGLESIEYLRRDMIGPVVSTPEALAATVAQVLDGTLDFKAANAVLKVECFAREQDCGRYAAEALTRFIEAPPPRPYHQIYVRDTLREQRIAEEDRKVADRKAGKVKKLQSALGLAPPRAPLTDSFAGLSTQDALLLKQLAVRLKAKGQVRQAPLGKSALQSLPWRVRLLRAALVVPRTLLAPVRALVERRLVAQVEERRLHGTPFAPSPRFKRLIRLLRVRRLAELANQFDAFETRGAAIWLSRLCAKRSESTGLTLYIKLLAKYDQQDELAGVVDELLSRPIERKLLYLQRAARAQDFVGTRGLQVSIARQEVRAFLLGKLKRSKNMRRNARWIGVLASNRWVNDVGRLAKTVALTTKSRERYLEVPRRSRRLMKQYFRLCEMANQNHLAHLAVGDFQCWADGEALPVSAVGDRPVVEFFLPPYFFSESETEAATREKICALLRATLDALVAQGVAIVPRHQFRLDGAQPSGHWPVSFSYHTCGNAAGRWHIKDSPLSGYFTFDSNGYSGWSSLSKLESLPAEALSASAEEVDEVWQRMQERFIQAGVSKYAQSTSRFKVPDNRYLFLPLQTVGDTVAKLAWIPTLALAYKLSELAHQHKFDLVVKRHPKCNSPDVEKFVRRYTGVSGIHFTDANIHEIIPGATAVVTVNSGVGLEALMHGKPVITTGESEYGFATLRSRNDAELLDNIGRASESVDVEHIKRFVYYYVAHYAVRGDNQDEVNGRVAKILAEPLSAGAAE